MIKRSRASGYQTVYAKLSEGNLAAEATSRPTAHESAAGSTTTEATVKSASANATVERTAAHESAINRTAAYKTTVRNKASVGKALVDKTFVKATAVEAISTVRFKTDTSATVVARVGFRSCRHSKERQEGYRQDWEYCFHHIVVRSCGALSKREVDCSLFDKSPKKVSDLHKTLNTRKISPIQIHRNLPRQIDFTENLHALCI